MSIEESPQKRAWQTRKERYGPSGRKPTEIEEMKKLLKEGEGTRGVDTTIRYPLPSVTCPVCERFLTLRLRCIEVKGKRRRKHIVEVK